MTDSIEELLKESVDAIHKQNTSRPIRCLCGCRVTFLTVQEYFRHRHPSAGRGGAA